MSLQSGAEIDPRGRKSPLEQIRSRRADVPVDTELVEAMIAAGETMEAIEAASGAGRHAVAVVLERWLRRNARLDILRVHASAVEQGEIEEALLCSGGSIKKVTAVLGGRVNEDLIRIVRGYLVGAQTA